MLTVVGGFVGIGNRFEHFMDPVIQKVEEPHTSNLESALAIAAADSKSEEHAENKGLETALMGVSVAIAFAGLGAGVVPLHCAAGVAGEDSRQLEWPLRTRAAISTGLTNCTLRC